MNDVLALISTVLDGAWDMLTNIEIPGLGFSVAALLVGLVLVNLGLAMLGYLLGFSFGSVNLFTVFTLRDRPRSGTPYGGGRGGAVRVSEARKNDEI